MVIEYDPRKNKSNKERHGVDMAETANFEWDSAIITVDTRKDYGEQRKIRVGYIGLRLHVMVFVIRHHNLRVISLRKANRRKRERYAKD